VSSSTGGPDSTFTVPDDVGMGFEGGVRVLQSLGNWWDPQHIIIVSQIWNIKKLLSSLVQKIRHSGILDTLND
jgi:hypothetical protein